MKYHCFLFLGQEWVMLGAVGAYDWNGTVVMQKASQIIIPHNTTFNTESAKKKEPLASYLGKVGMSSIASSWAFVLFLFSTPFAYVYAGLLETV